MNELHVATKLKIQDGKLDEFKALAAKSMTVVKEKDEINNCCWMVETTVTAGSRGR